MRGSPIVKAALGLGIAMLRVVAARRHRRAMTWVALTVLLASCSSTPPTSGPSPPVSPTAALPSPPPASPTFSVDDRTAVEDLVRNYFQTVATGDFQKLKPMATGELVKAIGFQQIVANVLGPASATLDLTKVEVASAEGGEVTVDVQGTITFPPPSRPTSLDGPAIVERVHGEWRMADYTRGGRSLRESLFTQLKDARQEKNGVVLQVIGVQLRDDATLVYATITNKNTHSVSANYVASFVDPKGNQYDNSDVGFNQVAAHASATSYYGWLNPLPVKTKTIRLIAKVFDDTTVASDDFDIHVSLIK